MSAIGRTWRITLAWLLIFSTVTAALQPLSPVFADIHIPPALKKRIEAPLLPVVPKPPSLPAPEEGKVEKGCLTDADCGDDSCFEKRDPDTSCPVAIVSVRRSCDRRRSLCETTVSIHTTPTFCTGNILNLPTCTPWYQYDGQRRYHFFREIDCGDSADGSPTCEPVTPCGLIRDACVAYGLHSPG